MYWTIEVHSVRYWLVETMIWLPWILKSNHIFSPASQSSAVQYDPSNYVGIDFRYLINSIETLHNQSTTSCTIFAQKDRIKLRSGLQCSTAVAVRFANNVTNPMPYFWYRVFTCSECCVPFHFSIDIVCCPCALWSMYMVQSISIIFAKRMEKFSFSFLPRTQKDSSISNEPVTSTLNWVKENAAIGCNGSNYPKNNKSELVAACFCLFACIVFGFGCLRRHQHFCSIPFLRLCFSWKSKSPTKLSANSNANWGDAGYNFFVWAANRKELSIKNPKTQTTRIEYRQIIKRRH